MVGVAQPVETDEAVHLNELPAAYRLGVWFVVLSLFVAFLILVGGTVRLTDSGLSIPEWPIINGSLLPPLSEAGWQTVYNTYYQTIHKVDPTQLTGTERESLMTMGAFKVIFAIEYFHRFVAALVGVLFLALLVQIRRQPMLRKRFGRRMIGLLVLLVCQAVLGGIVVKYDLRAELVALHLGIAFIFFAALVWTALQLLPRAVPQSSAPPPLLARLSWLSLAAVYLQIVVGGLVAGTKAGHIMNTWPLMGERLVPPATQLFADYYGGIVLNFLSNPMLIQFVHRWWAFVAAILIVVQVFYALRFSLSRRARLALRAVMTVLVLQLVLGITTLLLQVPIVLGIAHLGVGLLLYALLLLIAFEVGERRTDEALA